MAAAPIEVSGRVVNDAGIAIGDASVSVQRSAIEVGETGHFSFELDSPATVSLRVQAPGHYPFVHTPHRSDFVSGRDAILPDIQLVARKAGRTLLLFAGDSMLSRRYFEPRAGEPPLVRRDSAFEDGKKLLGALRPYVELADFASVNMETQLSSAVLDDPVPKSVTFYSPVELAALLQWTGFDYVALGNNHMYDYRDAGLASTFKALAGTSLAYSGAGTNEAEARNPASTNIGGRDYRFLSYVGWRGTFEPSQVAEADKGGAALGNTTVIAADLVTLPDAAVVVLQLHAGLEYAALPALTEQTTLRQAIRDGADVVIGHHPHVLQGFEIVDNRLIAFSMGNFLFDQYHYTTQLGMLLYVWMDGDTLHRAEAVPLHINGYVPTPAIGLFRHAVLTRLARLFGAHDQSWIEGRNASLKTGDNNHLEIRVPAGGAVRTGMKVFERVFSLSAPATVSGRLRVDGRVRIRFLLQRRRETDTLDEALLNGPISEIGAWEGSATGWTTFSLDFKHPRIATRSIRLLVEVVDSSDDSAGATVALDDLAWVEWHTPWLEPGDVREAPVFATHLMLQPKPEP